MEQYLLDFKDGPYYFVESFLSTQESSSLFNELKKETPWRQDQIKIFGKTHPLPRLQAWYGDPGLSYTYSGIKLEPLSWTQNLLQIKRKIEALTSSKFNTVLLNYYRDGRDSNGWHSDDEKELGTEPEIASLSLGGERIFQVKHKADGDRHSINLKAGSLLIMAGNSQKAWKHQIPKTKLNVKPRINLTFRRVFH